MNTVPRVQYRSLTILNDSLSVGTQYLELMEVMIKYWTGRGIKKQSVPRIFYVFDIIADKDNRFMKAIKRNHLHREQEKMEVLTSKAYLSSINILVLNFFCEYNHYENVSYSRLESFFLNTNNYYSWGVIFSVPNFCLLTRGFRFVSFNIISLPGAFTTYVY